MLKQLELPYSGKFLRGTKIVFFGGMLVNAKIKTGKFERVIGRWPSDIIQDHGTNLD